MGNVKLIADKKEDLKKIEIRDWRGHHITTIDDEFIDKMARLIGVYAFGVYVILCRHSGVEKSCWPSVELISDKLGMSERKVRSSVKVLELYHVIKVSRRRGSHSVYHLLEKSKWKMDGTLFYKCGMPGVKFGKKDG